MSCSFSTDFAVSHRISFLDDDDVLWVDLEVHLLDLSAVIIRGLILVWGLFLTGLMFDADVGKSFDFEDELQSTSVCLHSNDSDSAPWLWVEKYPPSTTTVLAGLVRKSSSQLPYSLVCDNHRYYKQ